MLPDSPFDLFEQWQQQAIDAGLKDPTAVALATADPSGGLWQRLVLLKGVSDGGFVFYTNYQSNKAMALAAEPRASMLFPWNELDRQVIVAGSVAAIGAEESDAYFASRPRDSQLGAWASSQSQPIDNRAALEAQYAAVADRFAGADIPRPPHWGGYRLHPDTIEFWQGGEHRMHDRFRYTRQSALWSVSRLQP
jgi:pyridoxamine 5'-phosphate oxidase